MKNLRGFALGLVLGLSIAIAGVGLAQNVSQTDANKKMESCCCMSSGCCGDSCAMKDGAMKNHAKVLDKHECCGGDSCAMMKKDGAKSGASTDKHECSCCGDSGDMKQMKDMKKS